MKAIIIGAGRGSRLGPNTDDMPKALVPVMGRPMLDWVLEAFAEAGWQSAAAITLRSGLAIGLSVLFDRPDPDAPVSTLLFEGRPQDLAFEKRAGISADQRHHVRFWMAGEAGGRPLWLGAASFDRGVGFSHETGQLTHHIGPDLDAERDLILASLDSAGLLSSTWETEGIGASFAVRVATPTGVS